MAPPHDVHRRYNALNGQWVLVSPHRTERPWQGQREATPAERHPRYDPACYLCPGNSRAGGAVNPDYPDTFVFDNDFAALRPDGVPAPYDVGLLRAETEQGLCRVICFSPRHDLTLPEMDLAAVRRVVDLWTAQFEDLGRRDFINYVQIFENKGQMMGYEMLGMPQRDITAEASAERLRSLSDVHYKVTATASR